MIGQEEAALQPQILFIKHNLLYFTQKQVI